MYASNTENEMIKPTSLSCSLDSMTRLIKLSGINTQEYLHCSISENEKKVIINIIKEKIS